LVNKWNLDQKGLEKRRAERDNIILEREEEMGEEEALLKTKQEKNLKKERREEIAGRIAKIKQKEINMQRQLEKEHKEKEIEKRKRKTLRPGQVIDRPEPVFRIFKHFAKRWKEALHKKEGLEEKILDKIR
jgi:hypothetical protein